MAVVGPLYDGVMIFDLGTETNCECFLTGTIVALLAGGRSKDTIFSGVDFGYLFRNSFPYRCFLLC